MQTIIYNSTGKIIMTTSEINLGIILTIETEIPTGYYAESINPETSEPILKPVPKTEEQQRLDELEAQVAALTGKEV